MWMKMHPASAGHPVTLVNDRQRCALRRLEQLRDPECQVRQRGGDDLLLGAKHAASVKATAGLMTHFQLLLGVINQPHLADAERTIGVRLGITVVDGGAGGDDFDDEICGGAMLRIEPSL